MHSSPIVGQPNWALVAVVAIATVAIATGCDETARRQRATQGEQAVASNAETSAPRDHDSVVAPAGSPASAAPRDPKVHDDVLVGGYFNVLTPRSADAGPPRYSIDFNAHCVGNGLRSLTKGYLAEASNDFPLFSIDGRFVAVTWTHPDSDVRYPDAVIAIARRDGDLAVPVEVIRISDRHDHSAYAPASQTCAIAQARVESSIKRAEAMLSKHTWLGFEKRDEPNWRLSGRFATTSVLGSPARLIDPKGEVRLEIATGANSFPLWRAASGPSPFGSTCKCQANPLRFYWLKASATLFVEFSHDCQRVECRSAHGFGFFRLAP